MQLISTILTSVLLASSVLADNTSSDWTTLKATGTPSGAITSYASSFAIAVVPVTTGTWTIKASTGAAQLEALSIEAAEKTASATVASVAAVATDDAVATSDADETATDSDSAAAATNTDDSSDSDSSYRKRHNFKRQLTVLARRDTDSTDTASGTYESYATAETDAVAASSTAETDDYDSVSASSTIASVATDAVSTDSSDPITTVSCAVNGTLSMTLKDGILVDSKGRIGSIVSNRQFQFDGPPQAGCIYANGWSITSDGYLAIGTTEIFYRCLSGGFYNLYDQNVAYQCSPIKFLATGIEDC
ncbi:hypothetical protein DASC09_037680 [Saccharomycopsis crataegensis]|uniref:Cell wall mannoprotein PIR1-like C-terminal domain-containing protein n=1 Tax=Saccharomycopsis crataegensis TaxID=43959 RepID=A0AAV5QNU5_9ASCO|nr:hypothetical protein DASC09_037680 [Saccharomycopsis crataegensis]